MAYEFQSTLFRSASHMCEAIAIEWMTGGGWQEIDFSNTTPEREADDCIAAWALDSKWMEARGIDRSDILSAFEGIASGTTTEGIETMGMQELLDHARSPAAIYNPIANPWAWDYENEKWVAVDGDGNLWESDESEIGAVMVATA